MEPSIEKKADKKPANPHDRFARKTVGNPLYAADFLRHYPDPFVAEHINLDRLVIAPTHFLTEELREVILDIALITRLRDEEGGSDVLLFLEHKSKPSRFAALQLLTQTALSLYFDWTAASYTESPKKFTPKIPLMFFLYSGDEDFDEVVFFQNIFPNIPEELRPFVPQFKMIIINLKRFNYGNLPGNPASQAIAESLKRAADGTFAEHLTHVLELVNAANLGNRQTWDLTINVTRYCTWVSHATSEQIVNSITTVFKKEGIEMANTIRKSLLQEGIEIGEARGEIKGEVRGEIRGKVKTISSILLARFNQVPLFIVESLNQRTDEIALESLAVHAATCSSLNEFAAEL